MADQLEQDDGGDLNNMFTDAMAESTPPEGEVTETLAEAVEPEVEVSDPAVAEPVAEDPAPVAEETPPEAPPADPEFQSLLNDAREAGLSVEGITDQQVLAKSILDQLKQQQPYVSYAKEIAPHADEIKQFFENRDKQAAPVQTPEEAWDTKKYLKDKYGGPDWKQEFDQAIESGFVVRDNETGLWAATPGREQFVAQLLPEMNSAQAHRARFWQGMTNGNPYENFYDVLEKPFMQAVEEKVTAILSARDGETKTLNAVESFEQANSSWMYATDPQTGQRVTTQQGSEFIATVNELRSDGITDPARLISRASQIHGIGSQPAQQQQPAAAPVQETPGTSAADPAAPPKQEEPKSAFLENARKRAQHAASGRQRGGDETPQVMTENDLQNLFVRAQRETASA